MLTERQKQQFFCIKSPDGKLALECCPGIGGSITSFQRHGNGLVADLFRPYDAILPLTPLNASSFPLTPYSNRIIGGKLAFKGKTYEVGPTFGNTGHQLHGDGWLLPWTISEAHHNRIVLTLKTTETEFTPYIYEAKQTYRLENSRLSIDMEIVNRSGIPLPFGLGHHPYFTRNDKTMLKAKIPKVWASRNIIPEKLVDVPEKWDFSTGVLLSDQHFNPPAHGVTGQDLMDHCFQGWDQVAEITWPDMDAKLVMGADPVFENFVIYIPAKENFFCAEPVTNIIDGFNLMERGIAGTGSIILNDGGILKGSIWFDIKAA